MGKRREVRRRGAFLRLLWWHFAGIETIEQPHPGGKVIPVVRRKCQLAQVQTTALIFVMTLRAVLGEEFGGPFYWCIVGERNAAQQRCCNEGATPTGKRRI